MLTHRNIGWGFLVVIALLGLCWYTMGLSLWYMGIPLIVYSGFAAWGSSSIQLGFYIPTFNRGKGNKYQLALSFDDGPVELYTTEVLDILSKHQIPATFFCIGRQISQHPEIFRRIHEEGHTIGNHTYHHSPKMGIFSAARVLEEIEQTDEQAKAVIEKSLNWFRPPFGVTNPMIAKAIKRSGHKVIGWNVRSLDTVIRDEEKVVARIMKQLQPGSIVLLHDRLPEAPNILSCLLAALKDTEYEIVEMEKLLNLSPYRD